MLEKLKPCREAIFPNKCTNTDYAVRESLPKFPHDAQRYMIYILRVHIPKRWVQKHWYYDAHGAKHPDIADRSRKCWKRSFLQKITVLSGEKTDQLSHDRLSYNSCTEASKAYGDMKGITCETVLMQLQTNWNMYQPRNSKHQQLSYDIGSKSVTGYRFDVAKKARLRREKEPAEQLVPI